MSGTNLRDEDFMLRFAEKVDKQGTYDCWEWLGAKVPKGYGMIGLNGKSVSAHRTSWQIFFGDIPKDKMVLHKCDNPGCVNPHHLFLGDNSINMKDACRKGRGAGQKLTVEDVKQIRNLYSTGKFTHINLATMFGVGGRNIGNIIQGITFGYVDQGV